jgi:hypothetical protein
MEKWGWIEENGGIVEGISWESDDASEAASIRSSIQGKGSVGFVAWLEVSE